MPVDNKPYPYNMPSESSFKSQIKLTRSALAKFEAIALIGLPTATQLALDELINMTGKFNRFNLYFVNDPRFFEVPTQVHNVLEDFFKKNPTYTKSPVYYKVTGLYQKGKNMAATAAKKGSSILFDVALISLYVSLHLLAVVNSQNLRLEKKSKAKTAPVCLLIILTTLRIFTNFYFLFNVHQGKCARLS